MPTVLTPDRPPNGRIPAWRALLHGLCLAVFLVACGGSSAPTDPTDPTGTPRDGRVVLQNETVYAAEITYLARTGADAPTLVRRRVGAGQSGEISRGPLPGGLQVEFDIVLLLPPETGFRIRRKASARIDGDLILRLYLDQQGDPFSSLVEPTTPTG